MTQITSTIICSCITLLVGALTLFGVIYQSNKQFDKQQAQAEAEHKILNQKFEDYKDFLHQVNKEIKNDINILSKRVDEHNNYGIKIPLMEKELESMEKRLSILEEK